MNLERFFEPLASAPLIASVQASPDSPVEHPGTLLRLAQASLQEGVKALRLQGVKNIKTIRAATGAPVIGLIKREYSDSSVYITPTLREVDQLLALGCEVIALDGTKRTRPKRTSLIQLINRIHQGGALAMADVDSEDSARYSLECGADWVGTTLAGYTSDRQPTPGPDFDLIRGILDFAPRRVVAEGRFYEPWQARAALLMGARAVVVGGSLNDPVKQTRAFMGAMCASEAPVGAVDIGGTWIRFGVFHRGRWVTEPVRTPLPHDRTARLVWIRERVRESGVRRLGISTGGTVDPRTRTVIEAKAIIPDHVGTCFAELAEEVYALNDGLATAWGHAMHPKFAGTRVATLALGTGVGFGWVDRGQIACGPRGEYPRLNDLPTTTGESFEELLGGAALSPNPTELQRERATRAAQEALERIHQLFMPDRVVLAGGVGLAPWFVLRGTEPTPYGHDAGLYGAAALALWPPAMLF